MTTADVDLPSLHRPLTIALFSWAIIAIAIAASGALASPPLPLVPALIFGLTIAGVLAHRRLPALRAFVARMDPRPAIAFHLVRVAFGLAFLSLGAALPEDFVRVAGPGDVVAGTLAIGAAIAASDLSSRPRRAIVLTWNALALADILAVILTAQRLILFARDPRMLGMMGRFPFATLPLFVVPMVLLTHLAIFARVRAASREA